MLSHQALVLTPVMCFTGLVGRAPPSMQLSAVILTKPWVYNPKPRALSPGPSDQAPEVARSCVGVDHGMVGRHAGDLQLWHKRPLPRWLPERMGVGYRSLVPRLSSRRGLCNSRRLSISGCSLAWIQASIEHLCVLFLSATPQPQLDA